ncbi:hypothetical protein GCM10007968_27800 [Sporolactobacillus putidus]|uniref:Uncharacterized protein n=1 Tax=Sporolactobacillus putidus TaxID=492735 RepID=A0A917W4N5_9BACL|nr:hypothetical protein GCM10007968_27800 [Sporolactobacillus putidus]
MNPSAKGKVESLKGNKHILIGIPQLLRLGMRKLAIKRNQENAIRFCIITMTYFFLLLYNSITQISYLASFRKASSQLKIGAVKTAVPNGKC